MRERTWGMVRLVESDSGMFWATAVDGAGANAVEIGRYKGASAEEALGQMAEEFAKRLSRITYQAQGFGE